MPDEFPMNDPKKIWQEQPTEAIPMTLDEIRRKAHKLQLIARLLALAWIAFGLVLCAGFARTSARGHVAIPRAGWAIMSLWCLYGVHHAFKWIWPGRLPADATFSTSLDFYRKELERQRDYGWRLWRRSGLAWVILGLAFLVVIPVLMGALQNPRILVNALPFCVMLGIWLVVFLSTRKRKQQELQQEIDELNAMDRGSR
jgi:hypothetical protein